MKDAPEENSGLNPQISVRQWVYDAHRRPCLVCGKEAAPANGIFVHEETGRPESTENGLHYAQPS